jgi:hypothetical protein
MSEQEKEDPSLKEDPTEEHDDKKGGLSAAQKKKLKAKAKA